MAQYFQKHQNQRNELETINKALKFVKKDYTIMKSLVLYGFNILKLMNENQISNQMIFKLYQKMLKMLFLKI